MAKDQGYLPEEYQGGLDEARYRELLALQLAKQQIPVGGQMVSGRYVKPSNLQYLSNTVNSALVGRETAQAQALRQAVMNKYTRDQQRAKEAVVAETAPREQQLMGPPAEGETMGIEQLPPNLLKAQRMAEASPFPEVQDLAKGLAERNKNLFDETAKHSGAESVRAAALAGGDVSKMRPTEWSPLKPQEVPGVGTFVTSQSTQGGQQLQGLQRVPELPSDKFGRSVAEDRLKDLVKMREGIAMAPEVQSKMLEAYKIVNSGLANTGKLATEVTGLQSFANRFGIAAPTAVPVTQYLQNTLAPAVAEMLRTIRGPGSQSNAELIQALSRAPDANQDPRALKAMIVQGIRAVERARNEYNDMLEKVKPVAVEYGAKPELVDFLNVKGGLGHAGTDVSRNMNEQEYNEIFNSPVLNILQQGLNTPATEPGQRRINRPKPLPAE